jgi:hypothetical protein
VLLPSLLSFYEGRFSAAGAWRSPPTHHLVGVLLKLVKALQVQERQGCAGIKLAVAGSEQWAMVLQWSSEAIQQLARGFPWVGEGKQVSAGMALKGQPIVRVRVPASTHPPAALRESLTTFSVVRELAVIRGW